VKDARASGSRGPSLRWFKSKPSGALRLAFRLPIYLYRLDLGWIFGYRALLLVHRGRKSGLRREAVLEVIRFDQLTGESEVLSGWGEKADWYRNIQASPTLEIRTGGRHYVPEQRFVALEENYAVICDYARRHPLAFRFFVKTFGFGYPLNRTGEAQRRFAQSLMLVVFRPGDEPNERGSLSEKRI
jgi:deazaflavin-dependent oxidoreductase (nitroreductase family)